MQNYCLNAVGENSFQVTSRCDSFCGFFAQKQDRLEELKNWLERHRFHISKLESIMRMVDNDAIDLDQVCLVLYLANSELNVHSRS